MENIKNIIVLTAVIFVSTFAQAQSNAEWTELKQVLNECKGIYSGVNNHVATSGMPDGPLLGNGKVGVVGACDTTWARFYITTTDFWSGIHLNAIPLPIGGVNIIVNGSDGKGVQQEQNMLDAEILTKLGYGKVNIRTWVAATRDLVISEVWTTGTKNVDLRVETWSNRSDIEKYPVSNGLSENKTGWVSRETESGNDADWVCRAALATRIVGPEGNTSLSGDNKASSSFTLQPGDHVFIVTAVRSGKNMTDHVKGSVAMVNDMNASTIDDLHQDHLAWWKDYWLKSYVRTYDDQLEKYYFGALYESACCYRAGSICGGLFGAWVTTDHPNWVGNYTLSYNHQSTIVGFASSNRPELMIPYLQQRYDWEAEGRKRAERGDINFVTGNRWGDKFKDGIPGIFEPITEAPWGNSADGDLYMGMTGGALWGALPILWYCNYTQDKDYLATTAYPYLKGITDFWEAYLVKEDGKWIIKYCGVQEWDSNDYNNPILFNAFVKDLFKNMIHYSKELNRDSDKQALWQDIVDNMKSLPTGDLKGYDVFKLCDEKMISEGGWPGIAFLAGQSTAVTMSSPDEVRRRYINTLDAYNSWQTHICSPGFLWACAVQGGYPAQSLLDKFRELLNTNMRRNFTVPKGGHGTESVANLEYINAMVLQSQEGFLRLFPEWPAQRAKFVRLRARGAFLVSSELKDGEVAYIELTSEKGKDCSILNPWPGYSVVIKDGRNQQVEFSLSRDKINFPTKPGETYYLKRGAQASTVQSTENNSYVKIGNQLWMAKNLDVTTFRNGDPVPEAKTKAEWIQAGKDKKPAYCYYGNSAANDNQYGKLYNWYAINDPRGLLPEGFHVPSEAEWHELASALGGQDVAGKALKSKEGFGAQAGGFRNHDGNFYGMGVNGYWWSSDRIFQDVVWDFLIDHKSSFVYRNYTKEGDGLYVRGVKD